MPRQLPLAPSVIAALAAFLAGASWGWSLDGPPGIVVLAWGAALLAVLTTGTRAHPGYFAALVLIAVSTAALLGGILRLVDGRGRDAAANGALLVGVNAAWVFAMVLAVVAVVGAVLRHRAHRQQGWTLAGAVSAEREAALRASIAEERAAMAGEIHDGIGHRIAYATLSIGRVSTEPDLDDRSRAALERVREDLADMTEELGETVHLLRRGEASRQPAGRTPAEVARGIELSGLEVRATGLELAADASVHASSALALVVEETASNAAKHAAGAPLMVSLAREGEELVLTTRTAPRRGDGPGSGTGLEALRRRLQLLGGSLEHTPPDSAGREPFEVRARVGRLAAPLAGNAWQLPNVAAERERSQREISRGLGRTAVTVVAVALAGLLAGAVMLVVRTELGVLSAAQYDRLEIGQSRSSALEELPAVQMPEPPRGQEPEDGDCLYYEASASWFERVDVYRVCLDDDILVDKERIPAP